MELKNFMHACTYRTKFYRMTAAVSLAACTCALGIPQLAYAKAEDAHAAAASSSATVVTSSHKSADTSLNGRDGSIRAKASDRNVNAAPVLSLIHI